MSSALPAYTPAPASPPCFDRTPSYRYEPNPDEQLIARVPPARPRQTHDFTKQSKSGSVTLRLAGQDGSSSLPEYGCGATVQGSVALAKPDTVMSVEVKTEGVLRLKEVAEGGTSTQSVLIDSQTLYSRSSGRGSCPSTLSFSITLPTTFFDEKDHFPLPPTYNVKLDGVPGFQAAIEYSVTAVVSKVKAKSSLFNNGNTIVATPFVYYPRSRPAEPIPVPLHIFSDTHGFVHNPAWSACRAKMTSRYPGGQDIISTMYLPASRIFCMAQPIPFHLTFTSSSYSLAAFMPFGPTASLLSPNKQATRVRLIRQSTVDVRNEVILGTKTNIWRTDVIGEGKLQFAGDGPDFLCFSGQIAVNPEVKVPGFKAGGLFVKDYLVVSMTPPDPTKCPFGDLRQVVPVRLTTDIWSGEGASDFGGYAPTVESDAPSDPEEYLEALPQLHTPRSP